MELTSTFRIRPQLTQVANIMKNSGRSLGLAGFVWDEISFFFDPKNTGHPKSNAISPSEEKVLHQ